MCGTEKKISICYLLLTPGNLDLGSGGANRSAKSLFPIILAARRFMSGFIWKLRIFMGLSFHFPICVDIIYC